MSHDTPSEHGEHQYRVHERQARNAEEAPVPTRVHYHKSERELELGYADGQQFRLSTEFLRVMSPSAEVRGHGAGQETLQVGMRHVGLANITQSGRYALKLHFDDGHDSGLYTWEYLWELANRRDAMWAYYLRQMEDAGASREPLGIPLNQL
ncbi:gamma-butyrobetaine hydroxylase-like domain-containing protein [Cobetia sp. L2A1]|uniref:gamma-butyrobetaine hydroxylase-like domain-containing protein n=1 Tax=Cobetia sp. L2A1 TaxID=2686360 RepID=UPI00131B3A63|nr:DUF971 domain-containing protein [Cobetia sp. L2A1]